MGLMARAFPFSYRVESYSELQLWLSGEIEDIQYTRIAANLQKLAMPTLIVHGRNDSSVHPGLTQYLEQQTQNDFISWLHVDAGHSVSTYSQEVLQTIAQFK